MDIKKIANPINLFNQVKGLILKPKTEWAVLKTKEVSKSDLINNLLIPSVFIVTAVGLIRFVLGFMYDGGSFFGTIISALSVLISYFLGSFVLHFLSKQKNFKGTQEVLVFNKLLAYTISTYALFNILLLIPGLGTFVSGLAGLYVLYIFYLGINSLVELENKKIFIALCIAVQLILAMSFSAIF